MKTRGMSRAAGNSDCKGDAVERGCQVAKNASLDQLVILKRDGTIQTEYTYGPDPRRHKG